MDKDIHEVYIKQTGMEAEIKIDGKPVNGISAINIEMRPQQYPKVILVPAVNELQFGDQASVDVYVGMLENETARMLIKACKKHLGVEDNQDDGSGD